MKSCSYVKKYKGIHKPRCNDGKGCDSCNETYKWLEGVLKGNQTMIDIQTEPEELR